MGVVALRNVASLSTPVCTQRVWNCIRWSWDLFERDEADSTRVYPLAGVLPTETQEARAGFTGAALRNILGREARPDFRRCGSPLSSNAMKNGVYQALFAKCPVC